MGSNINKSIGTHSKHNHKDVYNIGKALGARDKVTEVVSNTKDHKNQNHVHWRRPKTSRPERNPKYPRKSIPTRNRMEAHCIIKYPLTTENSMKKIEEENTIVFLVHSEANKSSIKSAVEKLYDVHVSKVNTQVQPDGQKRACVKLDVGNDALDIANKIGII
ncbi:hypothetical protein TKK_0003554 [Trichogramma kaykai]